MVEKLYNFFDKIGPESSRGIPSENKSGVTAEG